MPIRAALRVEGFRDAIHGYAELGERARRPEPALRSAAVRGDLQASERRRFARRFRRVTPAWAAEKRRRGLDPRSLRATGQLERALETADQTKGIRHTVFNGELRWGVIGGSSDLYYAHILAQDPRRRMVVIDKPARESIARRVQLYIDTGFTDTNELNAARGR